MLINYIIYICVYVSMRTIYICGHIPNTETDVVYVLYKSQDQKY